MTCNGPSRGSSLITIRSEKVVNSRSTRIRHLQRGSNSNRTSRIRFISFLANPDPKSRPRPITILILRARTRYRYNPTSKATLCQQDNIRKILNISKSNHGHPQPSKPGLAPDRRSRSLCPAKGMPTTRAIAIAMIMACADSRCQGTDIQTQATPLGQLRLHTVEGTGQSSGLIPLHHL
jgi:hypothetical protein